MTRITRRRDLVRRAAALPAVRRAAAAPRRRALVESSPSGPASAGSVRRERSLHQRRHPADDPRGRRGRPPPWPADLLRGRGRRDRHDGGQGPGQPARASSSEGADATQSRGDESGHVLVRSPAPPRRRLQPGQSVLILGATGNAGAMAVQVARLLGAGRIIGRRSGFPGRLQALTGRPGCRRGRPAHRADARRPRARPSPRPPPRPISFLTTMAGAPAHANDDRRCSRPGPTAAACARLGPDRRGRRRHGTELPFFALRSANLRRAAASGAVGAADYLAELPSLISEISAGRITVTRGRPAGRCRAGLDPPGDPR